MKLALNVRALGALAPVVHHLGIKRSIKAFGFFGTFAALTFAALPAPVQAAVYTWDDIASNVGIDDAKEFAVTTIVGIFVAFLVVMVGIAIALYVYRKAKRLGK